MPSITESVVATGLAAGAWALCERARRIRSDKTTFHSSEEWTTKRKAFAGLSADKLLVITDFDATITTGDSEQCHDVMGNSKLLSDAFREEFAPLLDWTNNAAIDGVEWWDAAHNFMLKHGTPQRAIIPRLVREAKMVPRPGALELLQRLSELKVPVLIVSAGLSDVIEEFLRQHGVLTENVTICSNRLNYEGDCTPKSVAPSPPITSFTKEYAYSSASTFFAEHAKRKAILQLGDSVTDVDPARHVPYDHLLSVGFLNARPDPAKHYATFDAVVHGNEGSLLPVTDLLEDIAPTQTIMRVLSSSLSLHLLGVNNINVEGMASPTAAAA